MTELMVDYHARVRAREQARGMVSGLLFKLKKDLLVFLEQVDPLEQLRLLRTANFINCRVNDKDIGLTVVIGADQKSLISTALAQFKKAIEAAGHEEDKGEVCRDDCSGCNDPVGQLLNDRRIISGQHRESEQLRELLSKRVRQLEVGIASHYFKVRHDTQKSAIPMYRENDRELWDLHGGLPVDNPATSLPPDFLTRRERHYDSQARATEGSEETTEYASPKSVVTADIVAEQSVKLGWLTEPRWIVLSGVDMHHVTWSAPSAHGYLMVRHYPDKHRAESQADEFNKIGRRPWEFEGWQAAATCTHGHGAGVGEQINHAREIYQKQFKDEELFQGYVDNVSSLLYDRAYLRNDKETRDGAAKAILNLIFGRTYTS